jgi:hypothetical protein
MIVFVTKKNHAAATQEIVEAATEVVFNYVDGVIAAVESKHALLVEEVAARHADMKGAAKILTLLVEIAAVQSKKIKGLTLDGFNTGHSVGNLYAHVEDDNDRILFLEDTVAELYAIVDDLQEQLGKRTVAKPTAARTADAAPPALSRPKKA